jgi:hypothetical protein
MLIMRLLHILTSICFIGELLGRWLAYAQAQRATDVHTAGALIRLSASKILTNTTTSEGTHEGTHEGTARVQSDPRLLTSVGATEPRRRRVAPPLKE